MRKLLLWLFGSCENRFFHKWFYFRKAFNKDSYYNYCICEYCGKHYEYILINYTDRFGRDRGSRREWVLKEEKNEEG